MVDTTGTEVISMQLLCPPSSSQLVGPCSAQDRQFMVMSMTKPLPKKEEEKEILSEIYQTEKGRL